MDITAILIAIFLLIAAFFSVVKYLLSNISIGNRLILVTLRLSWLLFITLAFFEPRFFFERFLTTKTTIPVLIDASKSMGLFSPDSSVNPLLEMFKEIKKQHNEYLSFTYFLFGDSLREMNKADTAQYNDTRSDFPLSLRARTGGAEKLVIVSDGHWTNPRIPADALSFPSVYFKQLPPPTPQPFIELKLEVPEQTEAGHPLTVGVDVSGFGATESEVVLTLRESDNIIKQQSVKTDSGYYRKSVEFVHRHRNRGRSLYTVDALHSASSEQTSRFFAHQNLPEQIHYSIHSSTPSLDQRFIKQALSRDNDFVSAKNPDILFLNVWDRAGREKFSSLKNYGVAVFFGTLPCDYETVPGTNHFSYSYAPNQRQPTAIPDNLPPAQEFIRCSAREIASKRDLFLAHSARASTDTIGVLYSGTYHNRRSLFCAVTGIWRWDFLPMALKRDENEAFLFIDLIVSNAKELLLNNLSDSFFIYPTHPPIETDSLRLSALLPSDMPFFTPVKISFSFLSDDTSHDTSFTFSSPGLIRKEFSLPALASSEYMMSCTLHLESRQHYSTKKFVVFQDNSERSITSQNTSFLKQFATALPQDRAILADLLTDYKPRGATVTETLTIDKKWPLLLLIFISMAVEWVLRRKFQLD